MLFKINLAIHHIYMSHTLTWAKRLVGLPAAIPGFSGGAHDSDNYSYHQYNTSYYNNSYRPVSQTGAYILLSNRKRRDCGGYTWGHAHKSCNIMKMWNGYYGDVNVQEVHTLEAMVIILEYLHDQTIKFNQQTKLSQSSRIENKYRIGCLKALSATNCTNISMSYWTILRFELPALFVREGNNTLAKGEQT